MNMIHTEGEASDVVDDMPSNSADVKIPELGALG